MTRLPVDPVRASFHACDNCGFTWHDRPAVQHCPNCRADVLDIASFEHREHAVLHVAQGGTGPDARRRP